MSPTERAFYDVVPHVHVEHHSHSGHKHSNHCHSNHCHSNHAHSNHSDKVAVHNRLAVLEIANGNDSSILRSHPCDGWPCETVPKHGNHGVPIYLAFAVIGNSFQPSLRALTVTGELRPWTILTHWSEWGELDWRLELWVVHDRPPERLHYGSSTYLLTRRLRI